MLPSFARAFPSSGLRNSRPSPPIETQIDSSDHVSLLGAPRQTSPQRPYTLPPIEHIDSRRSSISPSQQQQRRPYSNSVSALDAPSSFSQSGRKRSHEVAIRHDVALSDESGAISSTTPSIRDVATSGMSTPSRHPNEHPTQDTQRRDSDTVDNENVDHIRTHPALVRVKEEEHEDSSPRPRANSHLSTGFQPSASDILSSHRQQPHGSQIHASTFMREPVGDMFRPGTYRKSPAPFASPIETTTASLPKKRRVTVSGADAPSAFRSVHLIPASLRGLNASAPPEVIEQLHTAMQLKQQQKALIIARRAGRSGGATPEPSCLSSSFVQTHMHRPSDLSGSQASPISPWDSAEVAGQTPSASTLPHEPASRTSSPSQETSRSPQTRSRKIRQTIGGPSSSTMAAALDLEMEVEEGQSDATQLTRRRTQSSVLPTTTSGVHGISSPGSSSALRRAKVGSHPAGRLTIAEMERSLDGYTAPFAYREIGSSARNSILPPRRADPYETDAERYTYGQAGGIGSPGGPIRHSHSSPKLFRSPPTGSAMPDAGPSGRPEITHPTSLSGPSSGYLRLDTETARHHSRPYRDDDNVQSGQSGFSTPSLPGVQTIQSGFSFSRSGGGDGIRSRRASFVGTPQTAASSHFTSRSPVAEMPQTRFPPPTSRAGPSQRPPLAASEPSSANLEFPPSASGNDPIMSRDRFVSFFEGMYESMVDARRVRAWIQEQQSIRAAESSSDLPPVSMPPSSTVHDNTETSRAISFGGASYVRADDVQSLIDARIEVVRQEGRREMEKMLRRVDELEKRVEEIEPEERQGSATPAALVPPLAPLPTSANRSVHASARTTPVDMAGEMDVDDGHADDRSRQDT